MKANRKKTDLSKFPLRLMPSVRSKAEQFSRTEGVSLNQFINVAVAEKLVHLEHDEWLASRRKPSADRIARALTILEKSGAKAPDSGDEMPVRFTSIRRSAEYKRALGASRKTQS
jgi:SOS-response transcriptional repressor LexA